MPIFFSHYYTHNTMSETKKASFHTLEREEYFANPPDEQKYPLLRDAVAPHIGSFNALTEGGMDSLLNLAAKEVGERVCFDGDDENLGNRLAIRVANVQLGRPTVSSRDKTTINRKVFPSECRERMTTYRARMVLTLGYSVNGGPEKFESREVGMIPIMMGSNRCHLEGMGPKDLVAHKEESEEQGGYFVINGLEKLIRLLIVQRRNHPLAIIRKSFVKRGNNYTTFGVQIRSVRPDQSSQTNVLHYLSDGGITMRFSWRKNEYLVPVMMILKALVETNDREIFDGIVASEGSNSFLTDRLELLLRNYKSYKLTSKQENLAFLGEKFRIVMDAPRDMSNEDVGRLMLKRVILVHLQDNTDKFRMLLFMIRKLYALVASECAPDNPDAVQHQEVLLGGFLYGMIIKERMEEYLTNFCAAVRSEIQKKRQPLHLDDPKIMQRICPRINEDIGRKLHYFLSTGNLVSHTGLDLQQTTGYTVIVEKINFHRFIAHFRMIHRGSFFAELKTTDVRKLLPESWGFLCPVHTPDGSPCGLLNHLAHKCLISVKKSDVADIDSVLNQLGISPAGALANTPQKSVVMLDGKIVGWCTHEIAQQAANTIRQWKVTGDSRLPQDLEIGLVPPSRGGQYPGLYLFAEASRFMRPVKHLATEKEDIVGPFEQVYLNVAVTPDEITNVHSHVEYSPTNILSILANMTPFSDFNQSPRNMYQCQMGKQAMGTPGVLTHRSDNKMYRLQTGQSPIVRAGLFDEYGLDNFPNGMNAVVAVISYTGYDMDDAMIINKSAHERGFGHGTIYKVEKVDLTEKQKAGDPTLLHFGFGPDNWPREWTQTLDVDGLPLVGAKLSNGDPIAAYYDSNSNKTMCIKYKSGETGFVEEVKLLGDDTAGELQKITVKLRIPRSPVIGDKFSSRHGQKGVCSQKWPTYDMPFSESGIQPDVIINPHAFPSRMTIGMFVESLAAKSGALHGMAQDATPWKFSETNTAAEYFGEQLLKAGYNYHGNEPMYSGVTGQELRCDIYVGVVFYQRLRHMVNDKFQVRSTGPVNPLTMQPVKGRKRSGGIRVGEMERDALIGHGTSYLLQDRLLNCSDYTQTSMCRSCGSLTATQEAQSTTGHRRGIKCRRCATQLEKGSFSWDSPPEGMWQDALGNCFVGGDDTTTVAIPFVLKYLNSELSAMGIKMKYNIDP